jgi:hypothetical protein
MSESLSQAGGISESEVKMAAGLSADGDPEETAAGPQGLSWSWELDLPELLGALAARADDGMAAGDAPAGPEDQEAVLDDICSAEAAGQARSLGTAEVAGRVAEYLPPGPGLAALLGRTPAAALRSRDLPAVAAGFRRLASWAQAAELSAVAQIAARAAAADADIGVLSDGRPARIGEDATAQVSLALVMSQFGSSWWTDLAVTLAWRLPGTGAALSAGDIDLTRARLIADATSALGEDAARAVEEAVLADAGCATPGQLRAALRRAVIAADPAGAEQRRKDAERRAKVGLYPDDEGTATLAGQNLPAIQAAAAFARITALARARKAAGDAGGIDLHRAQVMIGLLLGTLPYIPPAKDAPPDEPPHDGSPTDGSPPSDGPPPAGRPPRDDAPADEPPREDRPRPGSRPTNDPPPADDRQPPDDASAGHDGGECADGWLPRDTDAPRTKAWTRSQPSSTVVTTMTMTGSRPGFPGRACPDQPPSAALPSAQTSAAPRPAASRPAGRPGPRQRRRGYWTCRCPGARWPGSPRYPGCSAASARSPLCRPGNSPATRRWTRPWPGGPSSPIHAVRPWPWLAYRAEAGANPAGTARKEADLSVGSS